jgi:hypothetical protein
VNKTEKRIMREHRRRPTSRQRTRRFALLWKRNGGIGGIDGFIRIVYTDEFMRWNAELLTRGGSFTVQP